MSVFPGFSRGCRTSVLIGLIGMQTGCTSVLTTASLRDLVWKTPDHATEVDPAGAGADKASASAAAAIAAEETDAGDGADAGRRTAAIEEAVKRLALLGRLDAATEATLVETLQRTQPEDWPVVVEAFAAALPPPEPPKPTEAPSATVVPDTSAGSASLPAAETAAAEGERRSAARPVAAGQNPAAKAANPVPVASPDAPEPPGVPNASAQPISFTPAASPESRAGVAAAPALAIQNACFASRVRGWGDVERFASPRFTAGQEVIVYFELDGLVAADTPAGRTTRVDTVLALIGPDGARLHTWRFEPLEETSSQQRRDYFARYLIVLPATAAAGCRLDLSVSDSVAANSAGTTLPLDIVAVQDGGR